MTETTPVVLLVLALLLTGPVPALLARSRWPERVPRAALVLWQAVALAAVLSALGAGASAGTLVMTLPSPGLGLILLHGVSLLLTVVVVARLLWSAHTLGMSLRARRRRQRHVVDLVGRPDRRAPGALVVDVARPLAYCIPGVRSRVVVSAPALDELGTDETAAVLAHERAHARARHDLVLEGFGVLHDAFPRLVRSSVALRSAAGLVEMLADDAARRQCGAVPLARALARMAHAPVPAGALGTGAVTPAVRIRRLAAPSSAAADAPLGAVPAWLVAALAYAAAVALVVVPTVAVAAPWLTALSHALLP
ncbi:M56 family metallopeptidase [Jiangella anatolica]|uniref:Zn-dependent protease with chaperone function n=1 Tax=Jiangella anatolica TaxID=2670374 RepID=A0A2W2BE75_9ACTN|nr:M56 family metallopeptidase [Jiangella anatolica]PZF85405.1 Zn-dependent protease with chaperone function [Jiangella anatolica]